MTRMQLDLGQLSDAAGLKVSIATRWYVLVLLTLVYAVNIADRFMISTLIEPIKAELHLSDSNAARCR
jgi:predicted MFS family arabinose efflux permease